jgi:Ni,Fe-hydrogenase III component G
VQPIILHIDIQNDSLIDWLKNNKFIVYSELVRYAEKLIKENLKEIQAIIVASLSENVVFVIKEEDVELTLEKAMKYFLSIEEYEQCSIINNLLILIGEKKKPKHDSRTIEAN